MEVSRSHEENLSRVTSWNSKQLLMNSDQQTFENLTNDHSQTNELILTDSCSVEKYQLFISNYS